MSRYFFINIGYLGICKLPPYILIGRIYSRILSRYAVLTLLTGVGIILP